VPTIHIEAGFIFRIFGPPREHGPAHLHIERPPDGLVVIRLGLRAGESPEVWKLYRMRRRDVLKAFRIVEREEEKFRTSWEAIHGKEAGE
jgi:hypothetical protein